LRVGVRSLLADGNAPALARAHQVMYTIYTTPEDAALLEADPAFTNLRRAVHVRFSLFGREEIDTSNYGSHGVPWQEAMELARRNAEVLFFIIPDLLYGRGTLLRWAQRFQDGAKAIFTLGPQVALETIVPDLEARYPSRGEPCDIDSEQLLELLYQHFHPLHAVMRHDSARRPGHPEYDLRIVAGQGVVIRDIVSHPFCLDPGYFLHFRHYSPEDHLDALAFEPCSTLSVEPLLKRVEQYYRPWPLDEIRLSNLGGWWNAFTTASCTRESEFPFELCLRREDGQLSRTGRRRAIAAGRFYRSQIVATGWLFRLFTELREHSLQRAATLLAAAVYTGRLRRRVGFRRGATLLVPTDAAIDRDGEHIRELLVSGRERALVDLLCDHVLPRKEELHSSRRYRKNLLRAEGLDPGSEPLFTARGLPAEPLLSGVCAGQPFHVGPFIVYPIDRVLRRADGAAPGTGAAPNHAELREWRPRARPRTFVVTPWARQSAFHMLLYYALHVPFLEPIVALLFPVYFARDRTDAAKRNGSSDVWQSARYTILLPITAAHHLALTLEKVPLSRRLVHLPMQLTRSLWQDGMSVTLDRIGAKVPIFGRAVLACRRLISMTRSSPPTAAKPEPVASLPKLLSDDVEVLNEIRCIRTLEAVEQVLADFEQKMNLSPAQSMPLAFVRRKLDELRKLSGQSLRQQLQAQLLRLTEAYPTWAEAWLELGFIYQDEGLIDPALTCFERAMQGRRLTDRASRNISPHALAAANHGRVLAAGGRYKEACGSFSECLSHDPEHRVVAVEYANALRQLGQVDLALTYYTQGMFYQESRWNLPLFPRDATRLSLSHLTPPTRGDEDALARATLGSSSGAALQAAK
jgi:tetratricopeptide (TPR) repeat protein